MNFNSDFPMRNRILILIGLILILSAEIRAEYSFDVGGQINIGMGSSDFAPFYLRANHHGKITQSRNAQIDIWAQDTLDLSKRFDFAWGIEALAGYANKVEYRRWNSETGKFEANMQGPAPIWLQQLYGEVKWRCLYLRLGLKDINSCFVDQDLSSGDLLWSGNSRGIPEARIGFVDFQTIPWTKQWLQFNACISYGKFVDTDWINNHFDYYSGKRNPGGYWTYKMAALQTNPEKPFSFRAGIQMSTIFGGNTFRYGDGILQSVTDNYSGFKDFIQVLLPFWSSEKEGYRVGDTRGTWDFAARYRFKTGETLRAYVQWPWEDSSGIAKKNGFDGLWGLEFRLGKRWWISNIVAEYLDLTHMSGPIYYDPQYGTANPVPYKGEGSDGYYNNFFYRSYVNYGLNMATPMVMGTLFNTGYEADNLYMDEITYFRVRGFHIAIEGSLGPDCDYMVKYNHRKGWGGTNRKTLIHPVEGDSFMAGATYRINRIPGLSLGAAIGIDHGTIPSSAFGAMLTLTYERPIIFSKRAK